MRSNTAFIVTLELPITKYAPDAEVEFTMLTPPPVTCHSMNLNPALAVIVGRFTVVPCVIATGFVTALLLGDVLFIGGIFISVVL